MRTFHVLPVLALCVILALVAVLPASAAIPPRGSQPVEPAPVQPDSTAALTPRVYLPAVARGPAAKVSAIELTQATQNDAQSVPMIAARPTVARVFLQAPLALTGQTVTLSATRNGVALAGSPLRRTGARAFTAPNRLNAAHSTNFLLPASWLSGNVVLTARVAEGGASLARTVAYQAAPPLRVMVVPIRYIHAPTGKTYAPPTTVDFPAYVQRMFPVPNVEVRWHAAITYRGNITASASDRFGAWEDLLTTVLTVKQSETFANDYVYVGILPEAIGDDHQLYYVGIGTSMRAVVSFEVGLAPAHELGHALARRHAPCGGASSPDPNYPYGGASIGAIGFDTSNSKLLDPAATTDLMSYCEEWISDYTYLGMMKTQRAAVQQSEPAAPGPTAADTAAGNAVLVRARLSPGKDATLLPLYALRATVPMQPPPPTDAALYQVAFLDAAGAELASHLLPAADAEEEGLSIRVLSALVPLPAGAIAAVELRLGDAVVARRAVNEPASPASGPAVAPVISSDGVQLNLAVPPGAPHLLRLAQGDRYTTLAVDAAGEELAFTLAELPAGSANVEAIVADQLAVDGPTVAAAAVPITIADAPPVVWITPPDMPLGADGIVLAGYATDGENGMLELQWYVNGEAAAQGPLLQFDSLAGSAAPAFVELRATDSAGQSASATVTLQPVQAGD